MNIMIVDDHFLIRAGLKLILKDVRDFSIVAEAASAEEALVILEKQRVDLMILDISMPGMGGLECISRAKNLNPNLKILVLSMYEDETCIRQAMQLGAQGYIPKTSFDNEIFDAIEVMQKGNFYLSSKAEQSLFMALFSKSEQEGKDPQKCLSPRELEIFQYLVKGYTITEIAEILSLSVKTVDTHKTKLLNKLECKKRSELVSLAIKYKMLM